MNVIQAVLGVVGLGSALYGAGRKAARNHIDKEIEREIAKAASLARDTVKGRTATYLNEAWRDYYISCAIKLFSLAAIIVIVLATDMARPLGALLATLLLLVGFAYDVARRRDEIWQILKLIRSYGLNVKKIAREVVAKSVFEEVLLQTNDVKVSRLAHLVWSMSGYKRDDKYDLIAKSVSQIASDALWSDIAAFVRVTSYRVAGLMAIYAVTAFVAIRWLTQG